MSLHPYQSVYPADLNFIRAGVLQSFSNNSQETSRISSCRSSSWCNSSFCPSCLRVAGYLKKDRLIAASAHIPRSQMKFGTFTTENVPLDQLRDTGRLIVQATKTTVSKLGIKDYIVRLEASNVQGSNQDYHPHTHILARVPSGGRKFVTAADWQGEWLDALPFWLRPLVGGSKIDTVRGIEASCAYVSKSPFAKCADASADTIRRVIDSIRAFKGIHKFTLRGQLAA